MAGITIAVGGRAHCAGTGLSRYRRLIEHNRQPAHQRSDRRSADHDEGSLRRRAPAECPIGHNGGPPLDPTAPPETG